MRAGHAWRRPCSPRASFSASGRVRCTTGPHGRHAFEPGSHDSTTPASTLFLIAGSYTPFGLLVMSEGWAIPVLTIVWAGAFAAIMLKLLWVHSPKWLSAAIGLGLGWVAVAAFSQLLRPPLAGLLLVVAGGLIYTGGAIVYVRRQPDPMPSVLGYHELFHVATLVATGCMYAAIASSSSRAAESRPASSTGRRSAASRTATASRPSTTRERLRGSGRCA